MNCFFDTSALVKLFHQEKGTARVEAIITDSNNVIWVLELVRLELFSAICRRFRDREIPADDFAGVISDIEVQLYDFAGIRLFTRASFLTQ